MVLLNERQTDRRRSKRLATEIDLDVGLLSYPSVVKGQTHGASKNIGRGGICFRSSKLFATDDVVVLHLRLPGWQRFRKGFSTLIDDERATSPLTAIARITWCGKESLAPYIHMGAQFINIYEDDYDALKMYLDDYA